MDKQKQVEVVYLEFVGPLFDNGCKITPRLLNGTDVQDAEFEDVLEITGDRDTDALLEDERQNQEVDDV